MGTPKRNAARDAVIVRRVVAGEPASTVARDYKLTPSRVSQILAEAGAVRADAQPKKNKRTRVWCMRCGWRGQRAADSMDLPCPECRAEGRFVACGVRPPTPELGQWRVRLHVSVNRETARRLGSRRHAKAREVLESWARAEAAAALPRQEQDS